MLISQYEKNMISNKSKNPRTSINLYQYIPRVFDGTLEMTDSEPDTPSHDDSDSNEARYLLAESEDVEMENVASGSKTNGSGKGPSRQNSVDYKADTP